MDGRVLTYRGSRSLWMIVGFLGFWSMMWTAGMIQQSTAHSGGQASQLYFGRIAMGLVVAGGAACFALYLLRTRYEIDESGQISMANVFGGKNDYGRPLSLHTYISGHEMGKPVYTARVQATKGSILYSSFSRDYDSFTQEIERLLGGALGSDSLLLEAYDQAAEKPAFSYRRSGKGWMSIAFFCVWCVFVFAISSRPHSIGPSWAIPLFVFALVYFVTLLFMMLNARAEFDENGNLIVTNLFGMKSSRGQPVSIKLVDQRALRLIYVKADTGRTVFFDGISNYDMLVAVLDRQIHRQKSNG